MHTLDKILRGEKKPTANVGFRRTLWRVSLLPAAALLLLLVPGARAQAGGAPNTPLLQTSPALAIRQFEPDANEPYQLGRGDAISIDFGGRTELSSKQIIGPDGKVTLPLAGSVDVAGQTREAAAQTILTAMAPYYASLSATVGVEKYSSNQVLLMGAVEHPGVQTFDRAPTLLEVVARGGGLLSGGNRGYGGDGPAGSAYNVNATLKPSVGGVPERCAIYRGSDKVLWVNLKQLLDSGDALADIRLKRDDIVYVPSGAERYISVLGQVQHPGALQLEDTSTLPKLIALSGGITPQAGRNPQIQVIQASTGKTRVIAWHDVLQPHALDLSLHSGDIVYIPQSGFNSVSYAIDRLSPLVTMFTAAALFTR